ncbi:MAG: spermidine/putrescine ABC transporter substrate-binding protein [Actinomycetota bacterium]
MPTDEERFERWLAAPPPNRVSRRGVLQGAGRGAAGLAALAFLAACGDSEPEPSASSGPDASPALPPPANQLSVAQWPLYIDRAKGGQRPSLEAFEKESGVDVEYQETINDNQEFFAKLIPLFEAGQPTGYDTIALSDWVVNLMRPLEWIEPLDWSALPTAEANMLEAFRDPAYDPGNAYSVPWQGGVTGIAYWPDLVPGGKIEAFSDLWNEELAGHVGMLTEMVDTMTLTLLSLGVDPQTATLDDAARAQERLIEQRDAGIVRQYEGQGYIDNLVKKNTWASMAWSGDVFYNRYLGGADGLEFVVPEEGGVIWTGPQEIPALAEHPTDAHMFMDFFYRPEIAAMVTDWVLYMTPVDGVQDLMRQKAANLSGADRTYYETLAESPLLFPPDDVGSANLYRYKAFDAEEFDAYNELFNGVVEN